jgi:hypothetical protein
MVLQNLLNEFTGKGQPVGSGLRGQPGFKERVDFGQVIGEVDGQPTTKASFVTQRTAPMSVLRGYNLMSERKLHVLVALQQALLGEVSPALRAVTVLYDDNSIHFDAYYDGNVSDDASEAMSRVETELIAAFPETHRISYSVKRLDYPALIPKDRVWVFYRQEG